MRNKLSILNIGLVLFLIIGSGHVDAAYVLKDGRLVKKKKTKSGGKCSKSI